MEQRGAEEEIRFFENVSERKTLNVCVLNLFTLIQEAWILIYESGEA